MPITAQRVCVPATGLAGDVNITPRHPAETASWIWHPEMAVDQTALLRFTLNVSSPADEDLMLHVTADQRFQLRIDGEPIGYGPDRGDLQHWSVASYAVHLPKGEHRVEVLAWWLAEGYPAAQMTMRGGFLLTADGEAAARFATGTAPWQVERLEHALALDVEGTKANHCGYAGHSLIVDAAAWRSPRSACAPKVIAGPVTKTVYGEQRALWQLSPSIMPEQRREIVAPGRVRAVWSGNPGQPVQEGGVGCAEWQQLVDGSAAVTVPANQQVCVLIDLGIYHCGYPELTISGGKDASVVTTWCEALFEAADGSAVGHKERKGQRDAVAGKVVNGVRDTLIADGSDHFSFSPLWWRAGRFVQLVITAADAAVTVQRFAVLGTRYPLDEDASFRSDDAAIDGVWPLLVRGLQMSAHETWVDCPYYEQLMYVGDTRTEALTAYTLARDDALSRHCLALFDWSRWATGWVAERYPSRPFQASGTYALIWPMCVADHWQWRGDAAFTRERMFGVRSLLELALAHRREDGRCGRLPGWSFVDWVPGWKTGMGPGVVEGDSSILDLHLVLALQAAAELEDALGEKICAERWRNHAQAIGRATVAQHWREDRSLLADTANCDQFSEHAQCLALIAGVLDPARATRCLDAWLAADDLAMATIYFSYYPLEALARAGRPDEIVRRLAFWKGLQDQGFTTTVEAPEPSRSDCHGWGAHPLHHLLASIAGIRPLKPGLSEVVVAPQPGPLKRIQASLPHPAGGVVTVDLVREGTALKGSVTLPKGVSGVFRWAGREQKLQSGENRVLDAAVGVV